MYSKVFQASLLLALSALIQIGAEKARVPSDVDPDYTLDEINDMFKEAYEKREYWDKIFNKMKNFPFMKNPRLNENERAEFESLARKKLNRFKSRLHTLEKDFGYKPPKK